MTLYSAREAAGFAAWLAARQRQLEQGRLLVRHSGGWRPDVGSSVDAAEGRAAGARLLSVACAAGLAGLRLDLPGSTVTLDAAPPGLQQLRWLALAGPRVALPAATSRLSALTALWLEAGSSALADGCLPPSLRSLAYAGPAGSPGTLPPAIPAAAAQLTLLQLCRVEVPADVSWLRRCAALRALALVDCTLAGGPPPPLLAELPGLDGLQVLDLSGSIRLGDASHLLSRLLQLPATLRELSLASCGLRAVPPSALALPNLQASGAGLQQGCPLWGGAPPSPAGAAFFRSEAQARSWAASRSLSQPGLPRPQQVLHLMGNPYLLESVPPWADLTSVLFQGAALPALREVGLDASRAAAVLVPLRRLPGLEVLHLRSEERPPDRWAGCTLVGNGGVPRLAGAPARAWPGHVPR